MPLLRPRSRTRRLRSAQEGGVGWNRCRVARGRGRRKWILIPLILFMLITPLSPAKDFHNNGLVLSPLGRVRGHYRREIVDMSSLRTFFFPRS